MSQAEQHILTFPHDDSYNEADFLVTSANNEAWEFVQSKQSDGEILPTELMAIYGDAGTGKTHLAHVFASKHNAKFIAKENIGSLSSSELLGAGDVWIIEDIDKINPSKTIEIGLFHLLNEIKSRRGKILITSKLHPTKISFSLPDLKSRISAFSAVKLHMADDDLLRAVLLKQFSDRQLDVSPNVIDYIMRRVTRSHIEVQKLVAKLDNAAMQQQRNITLHLVRQVL